MRTYLAAAALAVASMTAGCGEEERPPQREQLVQLSVTAPADAERTRDETVEISGTVKPAGAAVQVRGEDVAVDVAGSARGRRPDFAAGRVVREQRVPLPDVVGRDADTAKEELEGLGLEVRSEDAGGFFDPLLPGDPSVCAMDPGPGEQVLPGTEVTLQVAREC